MVRRILNPLALVPPVRDAHRRGNIVMIHIGRCGSTVLGNLLNQHPHITWDGEVYQDVFRERQHADKSLPPIEDVDPARYLLHRSNRVFSRFYGFEVKFFHLRALGTNIDSYLEDLESLLGKMHFIVLERRNTLRVIVSTVAARRTGVWHLGESQARPADLVNVDVDAVFVNRKNDGLLDLLREFSRDFSDTEALLRNRSALHLTYEDDIRRDPRAAYRKVCDFLDLPAVPVSTRFVPTNPAPLHEIVENFDDIRSLLTGTEFEWMLETKRNPTSPIEK